MLLTATEHELLCRLVNDDRAAFNTIYRQYFHAVYDNAVKITRDNTVAEDVLQEVFITLWEKRKTIDTNRSVGGWLFVICYNKSVNQLRKKIIDSLACRRLQRAVAADSTNDDTGLYDLRWKMVENAMTRLSPQKRKVFELCKLDGKTYAETAAILNISKYTVKEYLLGALCFVKEHVKDQLCRSIVISVYLFSRIFT